MKKKTTQEIILDLEKRPARFTEADRYKIERAYRMSETIYVLLLCMLVCAAIVLFLGIYTGST